MYYFVLYGHGAYLSVVCTPLGRIHGCNSKRVFLQYKRKEAVGFHCFHYIFKHFSTLISTVGEHLSREFYILIGVVLIVLLSLFAASPFAAPNPPVDADPVSSAPSKIPTSILSAENGKPACGQESHTCGLAVECCEGFFCSDSDICVRCAGVGAPCGATAPEAECCPGGYCYLGNCEEQTMHFCSDTETGPNYYSAGSASGKYEGRYGAYADYCLDSNTLNEYYCQVNNEYSPVLAANILCPNGCSEGSCN